MRLEPLNRRPMASGIGSPSPCSAGSDEEEMEILMNNSIHQHQGTPQGEAPMTSFVCLLVGGGRMLQWLIADARNKKPSVLVCVGTRGCQLDHGAPTRVLVIALAQKGSSLAW